MWQNPKYSLGQATHVWGVQNPFLFYTLNLTKSTIGFFILDFFEGESAHNKAKRIIFKSWINCHTCQIVTHETGVHHQICWMLATKNGFLFWIHAPQTTTLVCILFKHCQRHNGPDGWVLLTIVTSLGHIVSSRTIPDKISSPLRINFRLSTKNQNLN